MKQQEDSQTLVNRVRTALQTEPGLELALLYGSVAAGTQRSDSDVDIAVLFDHPLNAEKKMQLIARLGSSLMRMIDLTDLYSLNGTILRHVLCKGRVLINHRPEKLEQCIQRMVYNQADMMPFVLRAQTARMERFLHG